MKLPLRPSDEQRRLEALRQYNLLDTLPEQALDDLTALAAHICEAPISLISLVDVAYELHKPTASSDRHYAVRYEPTRADGAAELVVVVITDITERKRTEDALRDRNTQLQLAVDLARMGVWSWDIRSDELLTIQGSGPISSLADGDHPKTGSAFMALVHPEDRAAVGERLERAKAEGVYEAEFRIILPVGDIRWVTARGQCVRDAAGVLNVRQTNLEEIWQFHSHEYRWPCD